MAFCRKEKSLPKTAGKVWFQRIDLVLINGVKCFRPAGEAAQFGRIACVREYKRTLAMDCRNVPLPPADRFLSQTNDRLFRALAFAPWCQHSACKP